MWFKVDPTPSSSETVLDDSYPVFAGYWYLVDGRVEMSDLHASTVRHLKLDIIKQGRTAIEVRRCNQPRRQAEVEARKTEHVPKEPISSVRVTERQTLAQIEKEKNQKTRDASHLYGSRLSKKIRKSSTIESKTMAEMLARR
jgi:hypothetical protein